jgi:hypothetical protein
VRRSPVPVLLVPVHLQQRAAARAA